MSASSTLSSAPHHRREDADFTNPAHLDGASVTTGGPVVAMKVTDLDALSPRSAEQPPNFLDYAQKGAQEIQAQIPKKGDYSVDDSSKEKTFSEKVNENWELAKEKLSEAWNTAGAGAATKSKERVQQMVGEQNNQSIDSSLASSSSSSSSSSSFSNMSGTTNTNTMSGPGVTHNNMSLSSNSSDATSTHSLTSTTMGEDGKEHSVQSSYSVRQVPLSDGKIEVREEWADREDNGPVKVKKETKVLDSDQVTLTK